MSTGVTKKFKFSSELKAIGAKSSGSRADAVKAIWAYATKNDLKVAQKVNGRNTGGIKPDDLMSEVFGSNKWHSLGKVAGTVSQNLVD